MEVAASFWRKTDRPAWIAPAMQETLPVSLVGEETRHSRLTLVALLRFRKAEVSADAPSLMLRTTDENQGLGDTCSAEFGPVSDEGSVAEGRRRALGRFL
jgi:hypothetical protein